jgi:hypothetical protein
LAVEVAPVKAPSVKAPNPVELEDRRLAVESASGSLRIENLELDEIPNRIPERYAQGKISLEEMSRQIHEYTAAI